MNDVLNKKLRYFALLLISEKDKSKRVEMKSKMIDDVYDLLSKMLGCPPDPNEKITWSYTEYQDLEYQLEREKRKKKTGKFDILSIKKSAKLTPLEFYHKLIEDKFDDYVMICNDPRNSYHKYYQSHDEEIVLGCEKMGGFNLPMDEIAALCKKSLVNNTPVEFDCDVVQHINAEERLLDKNCYGYDLLFNADFEKISKKDKLSLFSCYPNHAMVLVGFDETDNEIKKWKVENSWGRSITENEINNDDGETSYRLDHDTFKDVVFNVVVHKKYFSKNLLNKYHKAKQTPVTMPENDVMF